VEERGKGKDRRKDEEGGEDGERKRKEEDREGTCSAVGTEN
jgi:hypothetical protein